MPSVALPPVTLLTCQVTAVFGVLMTDAVNACVPIPTCKLALAGATETTTGEVTATAARQALAPAFDGALVVAVLGYTATSAVS